MHNQSIGFTGNKGEVFDQYRTHNGSALNTAVFAYALEVNFSTGSSESLKGNISLVR